MSQFAYQENLSRIPQQVRRIPRRLAKEARMSETVFPRARIIAGRVGPPRPLPIGYGLLIGALISIGLWIGIGVAIMRFWP